MKPEDNQKKVASLLSQLRFLTKDINKLADAFEEQADQMKPRTKKERAKVLISLIENGNDPVFDAVIKLVTKNKKT